MQSLVKLACYFNVMISPAVMVAGLLVKQHTDADGNMRGGKKRDLPLFCKSEKRKGSEKGSASQMKTKLQKLKNSSKLASKL